MLQNDDRTVILRAGIIGEREDGPVQRSIDRRARLGEQVDAEMNGAEFVGGTAAGGKGGRGVKIARLVILPDGNFDSRLSHDFGNARCQQRLLVLGGSELSSGLPRLRSRTATGSVRMSVSSTGPNSSVCSLSQ